MRIGVLSDSHWRCGKPHPLVADIFAGVDLILHAGDVGDSELLDYLRTIAPVDHVAGNCDSSFEALRWPRRRVIQVEKITIGLIHGDGAGGTTPRRARQAFIEQPVDVVVFGHSHQPLCEVGSDGVLLFNPGSTSLPRGQVRRGSCGLLTVIGKEVTGEIIYL